MREATWINQGVDVKQCQNINDVLEAAGLNYNVISRPLQYKFGTEVFEVPEKVINIKEDQPDHVFGVVTNEYHIVQNKEAFDFVNGIDEDLKFLKAGETRNGLIYIITELPELEVLGDKIKPNIIFQNSHNAKSGVKANICMLRIVCQNQFAYAFRNATNSINIRHSSGTINARMAEARNVLSNTYEYIANYKWNAEKLAGKHITDSDLQKVISEMLLKGKSIEEKTEAESAKVDAFMNAYRHEDNANFTGTAWGLVNAWTDYSTHIAPKRDTNTFEETRFITNSLNNRPLEKLMEMVEGF